MVAIALQSLFVRSMRRIVPELRLDLAAENVPDPLVVSATLHFLKRKADFAPQRSPFLPLFNGQV